jgi:hypothetical protein
MVVIATEFDGVNHDTLPADFLGASFAVERFASPLPNGATLPVVRMRKLPAFPAQV